MQSLLIYRVDAPKLTSLSLWQYITYSWLSTLYFYIASIEKINALGSFFLYSPNEFHLSYVNPPNLLPVFDFTIVIVFGISSHNKWN